MNEMRNHEREEDARQVDDDNGFADECNSGECHSAHRDTTHKRDASPSAPAAETNAATTPLHAAPSVERRRRRRLEQTGATSPASRRGRQANIDYFNDYYMGNTDRIGRMNNSTTMALLSLLFLVVVVQKDKIIHDIRQYKASGGKGISLLLRILTTHIILSPIQYFKNLLFEIVSLMLHGLTHPLELPSVVWGVICLLMEDSRQLFDSLFRSVLVVENANVATREGRAMRNVGSRDESLPELENEDMCSSPKEEEDSKGKDDALIKQLEQQKPNEHIEHELKRYDVDELPPAFLSENDYPKGWLVHHPIHGVITREVSLDLKES